MPQFRLRLLNGAAGDETLAVGQQHDLEHDAWVIGTGTDFVVLEPGVQRAEVKFVVNQVVQCEGEAAGNDLFTEHHRHSKLLRSWGL